MIKPSNQSEIVLYTTADGTVKIDTIFQNETIWLSQKKMAELFEIDRTVISKHLRTIFETNELEEKAVSAKIAHTAEDGKTYQTKFYNLDAISAETKRLEAIYQQKLENLKVLKQSVLQKAFEGEL